MVPLVKVPGETNTADLMTKHLASPMILRHLKNLNMSHKEGRATAAAQLHAVSRGRRQDFWSERGERGRWVRVHNAPRTTKFAPWQAERGPGRKTRLRATRVSQGTISGGKRFKAEDDWTQPFSVLEDPTKPWTGQTIFLVDRCHTPELGTDQRRQRASASNRSTTARVSWADI